MSAAALHEQLVRLDGLVRKHWNQPLVANAAARASASLDLLLAALPADGAQLGIGGNAFEFVGSRFIDQIQYQFADVDAVAEHGGKVFVTQQTGDPLAWLQVQNIGYWVDATIVAFVGPGNTTEYKAVYTLIYSKDDAIRSVEGTHSLV